MKLSPSHLRYLTWTLALGLAVWILGQLPLADAQRQLADLSPAQWSAWLLLNCLIIILLSWRWLVLVRAAKLDISLLQLVRIRQAGQLVSFVTPGPQFGGEPFQVYWLWRKFALPAYGALLAVGLDRFYEFWVNFAILLLAVMMLLASSSVDFVDWQAVAAALFGLLLLMAGFVWFLIAYPELVRRLISRLSDRWRAHASIGEAEAHWSQFNDLLRRIVSRRRPELAIALFLSLLAWAGMILEFWLLLYFVDVPMTPTNFIFVFTVVRLAFLMPLPGGIGSVEAALFWAFQALALPLPAAAALILLMRLRDVLILGSGALLIPGLQSPSANAEPSN